MQIIGENLEQYDNEHLPLICENVTELALVRYLMDSHHRHQKDLAPIFEVWPSKCF
jgi:HTH-type transcriptional regulator/antitoxin HigA